MALLVKCISLLEKYFLFEIIIEKCIFVILFGITLGRPLSMMRNPDQMVYLNKGDHIHPPLTRKRPSPGVTPHCPNQALNDVESSADTQGHPGHSTVGDMATGLFFVYFAMLLHYFFSKVSYR